MRHSNTQREPSPDQVQPLPRGAPFAPASTVLAAARYRELLHLLEWRDRAWHERACGNLERVHLETVAAKINRHLPAAVRADLESLPDDAYLAMLRAPDVYHAAFFETRERLASQMQRWLAVERAQVGAPTALHGTMRAASCDRHVVTSAGRVTAIDVMPRLRGGPAMDTSSDLHGRMTNRFPNRMLVRPSQRDRALVADKLDEALAALAERSELAGQLVRRMIQVVCVRTAVDDGRCDVSNDPSSPGVVHVTNAHSTRRSVAELAAALLHAAVLQAMYRWELRYPALLSPEASATTARSPWTGEVFTLPDFLHSCFAWYAAANLWRDGDAGEDLATTRLRRTAESGFALLPLTALGQHRSALAPSLHAALAAMTEAVAGT